MLYKIDNERRISACLMPVLFERKRSTIMIALCLINIKATAMNKHVA